MTPTDNRRWWILGAMGSILGVILLDETAVGVALHSIQDELKISEFTAHWVVNIYLLTLAGLAGAAGRLGDIFGTRILVTAGLLVFGVGSAAAGFATDGTLLLLARAIQGVGAAIIFPLSLVLVSMSFDESERGMALGVYGAIGTSFLALGPLVGGLLTETLSWRWIFWINPVIVVLVAGVVWRFWCDPPIEPEERFDVMGLIGLVGGLTLLVFGIMEGPEEGWGKTDVIASLALGAFLLMAFVIVELRQSTPLIAVRLFTNPTFAASNLIVGLAQYVKIATFVFAALYFQAVEGWNPIWAGVALLPAVIPPALMATVAGKAADRHGTRGPSLLGVAMTTLGLVAVAIGMGVKSDAVIFTGLLLFGVAVPFLFVPPQRAVMMAVAPRMQGQAGGIVLSSQLVGGTLGMAICSTVLVTTGSHAAVFWVCAAVSLLILAYAYLAIDRDEAPTPQGSA